MKKIASLATGILFTVLSVSVCAQKPAVFESSGKAIRGYDPVSYFIDGKPLPGKEEFTWEWNNANWFFSDQQHLDSFKVNPEKYAPQYGGYCAYGMYEGHKAPTSPDAWTIVNGKLYFNYNLKVRELWRNKSEEKIATADKNWPVVMDKE